MQSTIFGLSARIVVATTGIAAILATWLYLGYLNGTLGRHVSIVERRINELAGEDLLMWETCYGWGRWGKLTGASMDATEQSADSPLEPTGALAKGKPPSSAG